MNKQKRVWRIATVIIVILLASNPESLELALAVNALGLDLFLILVQLQLLLFFRTWIRWNLSSYMLVHWEYSVLLREKLNPALMMQVLAGIFCLGNIIVF